MVTKERELTTVSKLLKAHKGLVAKNLVYAAITEGVIPSVRLGKKILVWSDCLEQLFEQGQKPDTNGNLNKRLHFLQPFG